MGEGGRRPGEGSTMKENPIIEIIIVGDEILSEPGRDTNSRHIAGVLARYGFGISGITVTGDVEAHIIRVLTGVTGKADAVLVTGGLGPTSDDLTIPAAAQAFGLPLVLDEPSLKAIEGFFLSRNRPMTESNRKQAMLPRNSQALKNKAGTAPGVFLEIGSTTFFFMPGVPFEMAGMLEQEVMPRLLERFSPQPVTSAILKITGIGESAMFDRIRGIPGVVETARFYPNPQGITVRIVAPGNSGFQADTIATAIREKLGPLMYAENDLSLEQVVGALLIAQGKTIAAAESCTGGLVADRLTNVPGSSAYFLLGVVAYSNEAKTSLLGVPRELIEAQGAVSGPVATAMAEGVRHISGADIGVSTTGIAGPGGGSALKPVGLMYQSLSHEGGTITNKLQFGEERRINKEQMSQSVLDMVRHFVQGTEL